MEQIFQTHQIKTPTDMNNTSFLSPKPINGYIFLSLIALLLSCQEVRDNAPDTISINYKAREHVNLSKYFELFRICPLETTSENLMGYITKIEMHNQDFYILDFTNNRIFHHDSSGRFINQLNKIGRGPEEYIRLMDMQVNDDGVFVLDVSRQAVLQYNHDLQFVQRIPISLNFSPTEFLVQKESMFFYSERNNTEQDYCFYRTNFQGEPLDSLVKRTPIKNKQQHTIRASNVFCFNSDSLFSPRFSNHIYSQNNHKIVYELDFKGKTFPEDKLDIENYNPFDTLSPYIVRDNIHQQDANLFISYFYNGRRYFFHYNTHSKSSLFNGDFVNDLIPRFRFFPRWQKNSYWIDCIDSYALINGFPDLPKTIKQLQPLQETDNPVLFIYKIKDLE